MNLLFKKYINTSATSDPIYFSNSTKTTVYNPDIRYRNNYGYSPITDINARNALLIFSENNEIKKAIKINAVNKHEWEIFETNLNQINNEFIIALSKKYPNLTSKDIKLCVYLKMNLSSKEIAPMMNISFRGVELHRYRLRKKLGLSQEETLSKFLLSV